MHVGILLQSVLQLAHISSRGRQMKLLALGGKCVHWGWNPEPFGVCNLAQAECAHGHTHKVHSAERVEE